TISLVYTEINPFLIPLKCPDAGGTVRVTRAGAEPYVLNAQHHLTVVNVHEDAKQTNKQTENNKKQSWEQAIAHINQLAKGKEKEKKKPKEAPAPKAEAKQTAQKQNAETPPLSKKQRKLLAKQQAEEEERKRQQQLEAKKRAEKKEAQKQQQQEASNKSNNAKKAAEQKKEDAKAKKRDEKESKRQEKEKEREKKESRLEKSGQAKQKAQQQQQQQQHQHQHQHNQQHQQHQQHQQQQQQQQQNNRKEKRKDQQQKQQVINITPDTTIEVVNNKKNGTVNEADKPASCSIMEQLSSGVQVADLKLPPGITLTRVQPNEKKEPAPIKSVPLWKCSQLAAAPTPVARPAPVINADPSMMMFSQETPKTIIIPEPAAPPVPAPKSKKSKKKSKKTEPEAKTEQPKMVTLRNPMFHPNLPPVQIATPPQKAKPDIRIPDPIPMPPAPCQATITPTSNGMYTIRNPLMSMMHQQSLMGGRGPAPPAYQPFCAYGPPARDELPSRLLNLASFTQKSDEGYSLFSTGEEQQAQASFLSADCPETVSPSPIGTRPDGRADSLFAHPVPEPIGTPMRRDDRRDYGIYTPFGQEENNVFRNALFSEERGREREREREVGGAGAGGREDLPYFQRLRAGSRLNSEVSIHCVTDSKFYKGQERYSEPPQPAEGRQSVFSHGWPEHTQQQQQQQQHMVHSHTPSEY
ncbi:mediator of RNA polymerase II transcription subunit 15-like, partial [Zerene cesonia]|uniref:mediator of RNA polymerase II transcription subunit 15-like n=1 Tax=Zerene cesonia TaxID=33412 RepID=UPI0018E596F1